MIKKSLKILSKLPRQSLFPAARLSLPSFSHKFSFCSSKEDLNKPEIKLEITSENVNEIIEKVNNKINNKINKSGLKRIKLCFS